MSTLFYDFPNHDRFKLPDGMTRVTAGRGGEAILVIGSERAILVDCGMAYCGEKTVQNIEAALARHHKTTLDGIVMSHTHYDHVGGLPYIKRRWPETVVYGSAKAKNKVFHSPTAHALMRELGTNARNLYSDNKDEILLEGLEVDVIISDGDKISIGDEFFQVLETKGHTDCSLSYVLEPRKIMFTSESTGVPENPTAIHASILKSYKESIKSAIRCKNYGAKQLICPHFGVMPEYFTEGYFDLYMKCAEVKRDFLLDLHKKGLSADEILVEYVEHHWSKERAMEQPKEAFTINTKHMINTILREFT